MVSQIKDTQTSKIDSWPIILNRKRLAASTSLTYFLSIIVPAQGPGSSLKVWLGSGAGTDGYVDPILQCYYQWGAIPPSLGAFLF